MKKIAILFCIVIIGVSCKVICCVDPTASAVSIHYVDGNGNDLFTNGQNGYFKDSVQVYDLKNEIPTFIPNGYYWSFWLQSSILTTGYTNNDIVNRYYTCLIHLKQGVDDTLKVHLTGNQQIGSFPDSIWYNGKLSKMNDSCACMTIIK